MKTICVMCPLGCPLDIEEVGDEIKVVGNTCKRGEVYGKAEYTRPVRSVTTLVRTASGEVVSVKTSAPVPKDKIFDIIALIGSLVVSDDVAIGDVALENALDLGVDIVVTGTPTSN